MMSRKHNTFPGEKPELPVPKNNPEVNQPADPKEPETAQEYPDTIPDELPPAEKPEKDKPLKPGENGY